MKIKSSEAVSGSWPVKRDDVDDMIVSTVEIIERGRVAYYETMLFHVKPNKVIDWSELYDVRSGCKDQALDNHKRLVETIVTAKRSKA